MFWNFPPDISPVSEDVRCNQEVKGGMLLSVFLIYYDYIRDSGRNRNRVMRSTLVDHDGGMHRAF
jgi:hypothetical protein